MKANDIKPGHIISFLILILAFILTYVFTRKPNPTGNTDTVLPTLKNVNNAFSESWFLKKAKSINADVIKLAEKYGYTSSRIVNICNQLYDCKGTFDDDETKLYNIFLAIPNIYMCSQISYSFNFVTKKNLRDFLAGFMSEKELQKLYTIVNSKKEI